MLTREDGRPLRDEWLLTRLKMLILKTVSEIMGHATVAFTACVYGTVAEEMYDAAASAIETFIPRKSTFGVSNESSSEARDE